MRRKERDGESEEEMRRGREGESKEDRGDINEMCNPTLKYMAVLLAVDSYLPRHVFPSVQTRSLYSTLRTAAASPVCRSDTHHSSYPYSGNSPEMECKSCWVCMTQAR